MNAPKILVLDLETAPNQAFTWGLWNQNISIDKIVNSGYVLCWAAKWLGKSDIMFDSIEQSSPKKMLKKIHALLEEADITLTYNGNSFDLPTLNKEFVTHGFAPPAPCKSIDLCKVVQSTFRFASSKLDFVCKALGLPSKIRHKGFELWVQCMRKDPQAWVSMTKYNKQDVVILEMLYERLRPWIKNHPNFASMTDTACCPSCGGTHFQKRGTSTTRIFKYQRYQCKCGFWFRSNAPMAVRRGEKFVPVTS